MSGRTLLKKGDFPYWNESAYTQSRNFASDLVIIKLGTNDAKPQNWRYGTNFVTDYEALIASYAALASHPRIVLATPCPVFKTGGYDINPSIVRTNIAPLTRDLAARLGLETVDFNARLDAHGEWFPDNVHPNTSGTTVMAMWFRNALVGSPGSQESPSLGLTRISTSRSVLTWPADHAGWVLMSRLLFRTNSAWSVVPEPTFNDGSWLSVTNISTASQRYYRLWKP